MAPRRAEDIPLKRVAALGCRLPSRLPAGEILKDITQNLWRLGDSIGCGGFGDVYLASSDIHKPVGPNAKYVIKIEPHNNGPLFVEMNFYIRAARKSIIENWCKAQNLRQVGIPSYEGSGSHIYEGERYRFLVMPRYGIDVGKVFVSNGRKLSNKLINSLAIQMLYALEYIHSQGYAHSDVKGSNILLKKNNQEYRTEIEKTQAFLVDFGLAYRYRTSNGVHKPFVHDERRAHEGTLEFTSRDAHHGTHSRRGDLETLGYNLLQWLCGRLPWENENGGLSPSADPDEIHDKKENYLLNVDSFMKQCFKTKNAPENITNYMKYIANLKFESKPDYEYLRSLFRQDLSLESLFGNKMFFANENSSSIKNHKKPYLRERKPCRQVNGEVRITRNTQLIVEQQQKKESDFSWEAVLACHPDKLAKISAQLPSSPLTPPPSPPPPSLPTYAMLAILQRMKERQTGLVRQRTNSKSSDNELKAKWMTPAMEEVALLRKKSLEQLDANANKTKRLTRSRMAQLKQINSSSKRSLQVDGRNGFKKQKLY
ncbi:PREDICTED: serine/threonine-protein kinase VRK1-like [Ceratosolen solmsi marchali]|uniref:non-specific serine/threonine protein kinase n=1 Tax=Ceratosolen solmsi marchali TaxID=326594 RepID=A0AAJ6YM25_9HYME|nr:PREDICTED: serine/threonine-protein kinase VRK1-like [Ceratosolen solmsi marchali]